MEIVFTVYNVMVWHYEMINAITLINIFIISHSYFFLFNQGLGDEENGKKLVKAYKLSVIRWISSGDLMFSMVTIVNKTVLYTWNLPRMFLSASCNSLHIVSFTSLSIFAITDWRSMLSPIPRCSQRQFLLTCVLFPLLCRSHFSYFCVHFIIFCGKLGILEIVAIPDSDSSKVVIVCFSTLNNTMETVFPKEFRWYYLRWICCCYCF